jgi:hypothetical protein
MSANLMDRCLVVRTHLIDRIGFDPSSSRSKITTKRLRLYLVMVKIGLDPNAEHFAVGRFLH